MGEFSQLIKTGDLKKLYNYLWKNYSFIKFLDNDNRYRCWDASSRTVTERTQFLFKRYLFTISIKSRQWYDWREDDGTRAGWTTRLQIMTLIIQNRNGLIRYKISTSSDQKQGPIYWIINLVLVVKDWKKQDLEKALKQLNFYEA